MTFEAEQKVIAEIKKFIIENLSLNDMKDEELEVEIENIVAEKIGSQYCSIDQRVSIVQQVYSSIRGFGLLDSIMSDESITEIR